MFSFFFHKIYLTAVLKYELNAKKRSEKVENLDKYKMLVGHAEASFEGIAAIVLRL